MHLDQGDLCVGAWSELLPQGITLLWVLWGVLSGFWNIHGIWQHMALQPCLCLAALLVLCQELWELLRDVASIVPGAGTGLSTLGIFVSSGSSL